MSTIPAVLPWLAVWTWANQVASLGLRFHVCKVKMVLPQGSYENPLRDPYLEGFGTGLAHSRGSGKGSFDPS